MLFQLLLASLPLMPSAAAAATSASCLQTARQRSMLPGNFISVLAEARHKHTGQPLTDVEITNQAGSSGLCQCTTDVLWSRSPEVLFAPWILTITLVTHATNGCSQTWLGMQAYMAVLGGLDSNAASILASLLPRCAWMFECLSAICRRRAIVLQLLSGASGTVNI